MIYSRKLTCPVCRNKFTSMKVKESKLRIEETDTDLFIKYKGDDHPLKYSAVVCPECGYSSLEQNFDYINTKRQTLIKEKITPKWVKKDYTQNRTLKESIDCFKLSLYCAEVMGFKKVELAGICLKIAWLYRLKKDKTEVRFLEISRRLYEQSYTEEDSEMDEITLLYLIGELSRRVGDMKNAITWLGRVISNPYIKNNPQIEKLARMQWEDIKEYRTLESKAN